MITTNVQDNILTERSAVIMQIYKFINVFIYICNDLNFKRGTANQIDNFVFFFTDSAH
ncbi:hypothetical protein QKQ25_gp022 [Hyphantria cunea granulovirus]|uniref:Uncharacterized protein n=1 Tax=Hyphantria cunea granulovirus TaxID=307448 RepID=A0AAE6D0K5_9BBAC|nr:hypothetical protein QKQ25_gp022 [Hyphantria cunea granulovirus]QBQ01575.1 hypothetical protein HycuGV_00022 [Hyphantria cunea granulovirus]